MANAVHVFHRVNGLHDLGPFFLGWAAPAVDDPEGARTPVARVRASIGNFLPIHHGVRRDARVEMTALSAEGAVLATVPEFGRQDAAKRDAIAVKIPANFVRGVKKVVKLFAVDV